MANNNCDSLVISFPNPINTLVLKVSHGENLTCEAVILQCLSHLQEQLQISAAQRKTDEGISTYVPAFGLQITSKKKKKTYIPLHYKFDPLNHHKEYKFCVRHIPPCPEKESLPQIPLDNLVWQLFILQAIEDFLRTKVQHGDNECELSKIMDLATIALIISFSNPPNDHCKRIDENFELHNFGLFTYRKHFSKAFIKRLAKSSCGPNFVFDWCFYYLRFRQWISHFKSENKFLGTYKLEFIYNFLHFHPHYGMEHYDVTRKEGEIWKECSLEIRMSTRGRSQQLGLYLDGVSFNLSG